MLAFYYQNSINKKSDLHIHKHKRELKTCSALSRDLWQQLEMAKITTDDEK